MSSYQLYVLHHVHVLLVVTPWYAAVSRPGTSFSIVIKQSNQVYELKSSGAKIDILKYSKVIEPKFVYKNFNPYQICLITHSWSNLYW